MAEPWLPVSREDLVLGLPAEDLYTFALARPPLSALSEAAGLERPGGFVAHEESVWQTQVRLRRAWRVFDALDAEAARTALGILDLGDTDGADETALRGALRARRRWCGLRSRATTETTGWARTVRAWPGRTPPPARREKEATTTKGANS